MKIAYFDCFSGIAGDMALGALLDCGVPLEALRAGLASLPVEGWQIDAEPVLQQGIHGLSVTISLHGQTDLDEADHHHHHHTHAHGRSMAEIRAIIEGSTLSERVRRDSLAIFERIAAAEAKLHHATPDAIHFHEIGGVDSLLDICGVAWCLEYLNVDEVHCSPLPSARGWVNCQHGRMPLPAPATLELLKNAPLIPAEVEGELVTPTGAGIVATLARGFGPMPALTPRAVGLGAGKKQFADRPNLLRVVLGETDASAAEGSESKQALEGLERRTLSVIECNIDDMSAEIYPFVMERLFEAGALDVWLQTIQMKKNRPGVLLSVLCATGRQEALVPILLRETTTLGLRLSRVERVALPRESTSVATPFGPIGVKTADWPQQGLRRAMPEWDDVAAAARRHGVAAREVYAAACRASEPTTTGITATTDGSRDSR